MTFRILDSREASEGQLSLWLSEMEPEKREKTAAMGGEAKAARICADHLARTMVKEASGAKEVRFSCDRLGKPYAVDLPVQFNLSHSGPYALCAVSARPVGADIQVLRPVKDALIRRVCSPEEVDYLCWQGDRSLQTARFIQLWTVKEALLKCCGTGIRRELRTVNTVINGNLSVSGYGLYTRLCEDYAFSVIYEE